MNLNDFSIFKVQPKVKYPEVWCAVCRKRVDHTIAEIDGSFTVRCHGETEVVPGDGAMIATLFVDEARAAKTRAARSAHNKSRRLFTSNRRNGWRGGELR